MTQVEALKLLDMPAGVPLTNELVNESFAHTVKRAHTDTGGAGADMDQLKQARDLLRQVVAGANNACRTCRGRGVIRAKMGTTPCAACKGTGDKRGS